METLKRCSRCKQEKPVTEFGKHQRRKDGLQSYCRECKRAYDREYAKKNAARNPDEIVVPSTKRCLGCEQELPVTEFGKNQGKKDGLRSYCRECHRAQAREYAKKNAARQPGEIVSPSEKRCPECGITRPSSEWYRDSTKRDGLRSRCKPCQRGRASKYRAENLEKVREKDRRWQKANPEKVRARDHRRRARKANANLYPHTKEDLIVFTRDYLGLDPEKCWYCALDGRDSPAEHVDHVIPLSKGGSEAVWNKRFACAKCNLSKSDKVWEAGQPMDLEAERIVAEQYLATRRWMIHKGLLNPAE